MSKKFLGDSITGTNELKKIAGNNYFKLVTFEGTQDIVIEGILTDLPTIGLATKWDDAPIGTLGNKIQEFFMNDLMKSTAYLVGGSTGYKNQIPIDEWTQRMYTGTSNQDISLKWRVYPNQTLAQTNAKQVIGTLTKFATINSDNKLSMEKMVKNIQGTLAQVRKEGGMMGAEFLSLLFGADSERSDDSKKAWLMKANRYFNENYMRIQEEVKKDFLGSNSSGDLPSPETQNTHAGIDGDETAEKRKEAIQKKKKAIEACRWVVDNFPTEDSDNLLNKKYYEMDIVYFLDSNGKIPDERSDVSIMNLDKLLIEPDKVIEAFNEDSSWQSAVERPMIERMIKRWAERMNQEMATFAGARDAKVEAMSNEKVRGAFEKLQDNMASEFASDSRYTNRNLGSSIWKLYIYEFIYKKPLVVIISSWNVTPSIEMFANEHAYYDFEITCKLDQVNSASTWEKMFNNLDVKQETYSYKNDKNLNGSWKNNSAGNGNNTQPQK